MVVWQKRSSTHQYVSVGLFLLLLVQSSVGFAQDNAPPQRESNTLRVAAFMTDLSDNSTKTISQAIENSTSVAQAVFSQISAVNADILWLGEIPNDINGVALAKIIPVLQQYGYTDFFTTDVNSGIQSGYDLDQDGDIDGRDAFGFGAYAGQDGMLIATKDLRIDFEQSRSFQHFLWSDMPGNRIPKGYLSLKAEKKVRLSTTGHWDVPIQTKFGTLHFLVSHHTAPVFDGSEDYNGRRNADEIRFWSDYVNGKSYIYDDAKLSGGLKPDALFVLAGAFNLDPVDGEGIKESIKDLLQNKHLQDVKPSSYTAKTASEKQGGINISHRGDPALDTVDWWEDGKNPPGNLRVDYVLPSTTLSIINSGVYWPIVDLDYDKNRPSHKIVWMDIQGKTE